MPIQIGNATVEYTPDGCLTRYADGSSFGALPHDTPDYDLIAKRLGYLKGTWRGAAPERARAEARMAYCRDHECAHHIASEWIMGRRSQVLWPLAHGYEPDPADAVQEEALTMTFQRWLRAGERPIMGSVDWCGIKARALALLDAV